MSPEIPAAEPGVPHDIRAFCAWLVGEGYVFTDRQSQVFRGHRILTCTRDTCTIRWVLDRGGWRFQLYGAGFSDVDYTADLWRAVLEDTDAPLHPRSIAEQAAYVQRALPAIEAAIASDPDIEVRLRVKLGDWLDRNFPDEPRGRAEGEPWPVGTYRPPPVYEWAWEQLQAQGFSLDEIYAPHSFGNRILLFARGIRIRFRRERGIWDDPEISGLDWGDKWFGPHIWAAYLNPEDPDFLKPRDEHVRFIVREVDRFEAAVRQDSELQGRLRKLSYTITKALLEQQGQHNLISLLRPE